MKDKLELNPTVLTKNLEITKLAQQVDNLRSELINLKEGIKSPLIIQTLEECYEALDFQDQEKHKTLKENLEKVLTFLISKAE